MYITTVTTVYVSHMIVTVCPVRSTRNIATGEPQRSILGPLLFLLYLNDLLNHISFPVFQFADDTSCMVTESSASSLWLSGAIAFQAMKIWCENNFLLLNDRKSTVLQYNLR